jgi:hypothetical protein
MPVTPEFPKRGAMPSPRSALAAAKPHVAIPGAPLNFLRKPQQISFWGNYADGDCVTAEEAFAKACNSPEVFISDNEVITWATNNGVLNGANLVQVLQWMENGGFSQNGDYYDDGPYFSVNWTDSTILQSAIFQGPVKLGVAGDQLNTAWWAAGSSSSGGKTWFGTGFASDSNEDHCVSLCGYGTFNWLAQQLGVPVPAGIDGTKQGYAMFTWDSIGIIDQPSTVAITQEAWLRQPTTVILAPAKFVAAGDLEDGRIQLFGIQSNGQMITRWKETTDPSSAWTAWANFQTPPGGVNYVCVGSLSDKRMQLFAAGAQGKAFSCWKTTTDPNAAWTAWSAFGSVCAAGDLEDGRMQLFDIQANGQIMTCWKETANPGSAWTAWANFQTPPGGVTSICVGYLPDKRMQLFATGAQGTAFSCWKTTTDPNSAWTAWSAFDGSALNFVAAGDLEDGQIQVFGIQTNGQIISRWKETADPGSAWTAWSNFQTPSGGVSSICVGYLSDKRMQLFATNAQGATFSCWKTTTDPSSAWTAWSSF